MSLLVAYYSLEGNCRELGDLMARVLGGDCLDIRPVKQPIPEKGFLRYLKGGKESIMKDTPELLPLEKNPRDYDLVIVGGPVWAWNIASPTRTFLARTDWTGLRVGVFCMHRGGRGAALASMRALVEGGGGTVAGAEDFKDLRWGDAGETRARAVEWARGLYDAGQVEEPQKGM